MLCRFTRTLGYRPVGETYLEADIEHQMMEYILSEGIAQPAYQCETVLRMSDDAVIGHERRISERLIKPMGRAARR